MKIKLLRDEEKEKFGGKKEKCDDKKEKEPDKIDKTKKQAQNTQLEDSTSRKRKLETIESNSNKLGSTEPNLRETKQKPNQETLDFKTPKKPRINSVTERSKFFQTLVEHQQIGQNCVNSNQNTKKKPKVRKNPEQHKKTTRKLTNT